MATTLNQTVARLTSSAIRDLLALTGSPEVISLAGGLPSVETFPAERVAAAAAAILAADPAVALQYGPTEGFGPLRNWVAGYESGRAGRPVAPEQVVITAGSQQALDLVARTICAPGDVVVVEQPGYLGALQAFRATGARLTPVRIDEHGLDVDELARRLADGLRPVAVHTVVGFHNPTGATLSLDRRRRLAELARRHDFWLIEDDPYAEIRFSGSPVRSVRGFDDAATVTLGSFSKTVAPGLRVGWAVLPPRLQAPVVRLKQAADLHAGALGQAVIADLVADGEWWSRHLDRIRAVYAARATALSAALGTTFGGRLRLTEPEGGMFLWGRFTDGTSTAELLPVALRHGVAFVPGAEFFVADPDPCTLRLSFTAATPDRLAEAARRLGRAHAELAVRVP